MPQQFLVEDGGAIQLTQNKDCTPDLTTRTSSASTSSARTGSSSASRSRCRRTIRRARGRRRSSGSIRASSPTRTTYDRPDRTFNKNAFPNFGTRSMEFFVRLGYAVVEPDTPIVGPQGQMNNNYVNDLRNDLAATIDELDRRGLADRTRLAIGGHSYGAFSTVNAMVHTPFFKAGHRRRRRLQPHADPDRVPERAARSVGGAATSTCRCRRSSTRTT